MFRLLDGKLMKCNCVAEKLCSTGRQWGTLSAEEHGRRSRKLKRAPVQHNTDLSSPDSQRTCTAENRRGPNRSDAATKGFQHEETENTR